MHVVVINVGRKPMNVEITVLFIKGVSSIGGTISRRHHTTIQSINQSDQKVFEADLIDDYIKKIT